MKYDTMYVLKATSQRIWLPAAVVLILFASRQTAVFAQTELSFTTSVIAEDANLWWARALGDVNGDGLPDLVLQDNNGHGGWLGWLEGSKKGGGWKRHIIAGEAPGGGTFASGDLDVGDIEGDGDADVAANGYWLENPGGDLTGAWTVRSIDAKWYTQDGDWSKNGTKTFCCDITGDGRVEVFISHSERSGYPVSWYDCNDPKKEKWTEHMIVKDLVAAHTLQVFDFDLDGDFDVLTGVNKNRAKGLKVNSWPVRVYLNQGDGKEWKALQLTDEGIYNGQAHDVDGDGDCDIIRLPTHDGERLEVLTNQIR